MKHSLITLVVLCGKINIETYLIQPSIL